MKKHIAVAVLVMLVYSGFTQQGSRLGAAQWVDSVYRSLTDDQKIAQLMVVRLSGIDPSTKKITFLDQQVEGDVLKYNIGGICLFQGGPLTQAQLINHFQHLTKTPILISIDAENGLGMRMDSVQPLPRQMTLGAVQDPDLIYQYGRLVGAQCRRMGIQVNYAPVVDINNNPDNPVINDRSFGEEKNRVIRSGIDYMRGLQDAGILACAKHFPGHGDVAVDSHLDLPVVAKTRLQLDSMELAPFKALVQAGVGAVMVGHLLVPALENNPNLASSLSNKIVTGLLKKQLKYKGLVLTDALEMQAVAKYFPPGETAVLSLVAGNDMLCLPGEIAPAIEKIRAAIGQGRIRWKDINARVKKVLLVKYQQGLANWEPIAMEHLTEDLNRDLADMSGRIAQGAITLLRQDEAAMALLKGTKKKIAYIGIGLSEDNEFARRMRTDYQAHIYYFDNGLDSMQAAATLALLSNRYDLVVLGVHNYNRFPAGHFGVSAAARWLISRLQQQQQTITLFFGNPYLIRDFCDAKTLLSCYDDTEITQVAAADLLRGRFTAAGRLPVSVCPSLPGGTGIVPPLRTLPVAAASALGFHPEKLLAIDSLCRDAIAKEATPGCVVLVARAGRIAYQKAFGYLSYEKTELAYPQTIYDLASVTKICATTLAVMKLYEGGNLDLKKTLGDYLPELIGSNKEHLNIYDVLLHQAGLKAFIPFYQETIDKSREGYPLASVYSARPNSLFRIRVADNLYMRANWLDTMFSRIRVSELGPTGRYIYSDNDFILMGKVVEAISGNRLDQYMQEHFYQPMAMTTTGYRPRDRFPLDRIAPTERELTFRRQLLRGDVHDPGAAMFGGVSGHAGLFSDAYDLALLAQMLLNGGVIDGQRLLNRETIDLFTAYHSDSSRRGLGFDKPEKDNPTRKDPYPCLSASSLTFGHTGFTGTCLWVDPKYQLIFIFLSNRVNPSGSNQLSLLNVRGNIMEAIYKSMDVYGKNDQ